MLSLLLVVAGVVALLVVSFPATALLAWAVGEPDPWTTAVTWLAADNPSVFGYLSLNMLLAALIVVALVAVRLGHWTSSGWLHSVAGRVRWGWLARCVLVLTPLWVLYIGAAWMADGADPGRPSADWLGLVLLTLLATPLQSAGEEYLFRGWLLVSIGSWFRSRWLALGIPTILSSALFAAAHGSPDVWIVLDLVGMSLTCVVLIWRTGGLEAAMALHVVNNVVVGLLGAATGTTADGYIDTETAGDPIQTLVSVLVCVVAAVLVLHQARRAGISRVVD